MEERLADKVGASCVSVVLSLKLLMQGWHIDINDLNVLVYKHRDGREVVHNPLDDGWSAAATPASAAANTRQNAGTELVGGARAPKERLSLKKRLEVRLVLAAGTLASSHCIFRTRLARKCHV